MFNIAIIALSAFVIWIVMPFIGCGIAIVTVFAASMCFGFAIVIAAMLAMMAHDMASA
jgi:hypothetical protein